MNMLIGKNFNYHSMFVLNHKWHTFIIGFLVGILMISVYLWILGGIINLLIHLYKYTFTDWVHGAENMIKEVVIMLAALELIRTLQSYLTHGRVKVIFILDAALVVLIGELISLWYGEYSTTEVLVNISVISMLIILRALTMRLAPIESGHFNCTHRQDIIPN